MVDITELIVSAFLFILLVFFFINKWQKSKPSKNPPPSPPIIGNLHQLGQFPHRRLHSLSKQYGEMMLLHFGNKAVLVASSAAAAIELLKNQDSIFANRPKLSLTDRLTYGSRDVAFAAYGEYWRQVRSICVLQLFTNKRVQSFRGVREEETTIMVDKIRNTQHSASAVNLSSLFGSLTNDVICRVALGRKYGDDGEGRKFRKILDEFVALSCCFSVGDYVPWLGWINWITGLDARVERLAKQFDQFLEGVIHQHREVGEKGNGLDLVDVLLQFQKESKDSSPVEDDTIKALC